MFELFDEIFGEVMGELGLSAWYELFDSEDFEIVRERISERLGYNCDECTDFVVWSTEMAEDL